MNAGWSSNVLPNRNCSKKTDITYYSLVTTSYSWLLILLMHDYFDICLSVCNLLLMHSILVTSPFWITCYRQLQHLQKRLIWKQIDTCKFLFKKCGWQDHRIRKKYVIHFNDLCFFFYCVLNIVKLSNFVNVTYLLTTFYCHVS